MATLTVLNKANEVVADGVTLGTFAQFKRQCGRGCALIVELDCGEEIMVDTCKLFKRLPKGVRYNARLLKRATTNLKGLGETTNYNVWEEA